jgi:methyl-accepting chemotaxis protein
VVFRHIEGSAGRSFADTLIGAGAESSLARVHRTVILDHAPLARISEWNTEMVINLPVGGGAADSFYSVQVRYPLDSLTDELERSRRSGFLWLGAVLGVGILGAVLVASQFTRPIRSLQDSFRRVESGDLEVNLVPERWSRDSAIPKRWRHV